MQIVARRESYPVRGESISVNAQVAVCHTCANDVSVSSLDDATLRRVYDHYRVAHGMLTSEEIVQIRTRYGLSQQSLANLLGWDLVTLQRYERGGLQDAAHDHALRSLSLPDDDEGHRS
jgi:putative zinc finger/helix-turn-helix YgiT family protein